MYLRIPGNDEFTIDKDLNLRKKGLDYPHEGGTIEIHLYGLLKKVTKQWLYGVAFYGLDMPKGFKDRFCEIEFADIDLRSHKVFEPFIPILRNPIMVNEKYRMIASIPKYAIADDGEVIEIETDNVVNQVYNKNGYYYVHFYHSRIKRSVGRSLHRLLAIAWKPDNDFMSKPVVNHIDGNKLNNNIDNLEWNSFAENIKHSVYNNLTDQTEGYRVLDMVTNTETKYPSMGEMTRALNISKISYLSDKMLLTCQYMVGDRYAIKSIDDTSPWIDALEYNRLLVAKGRSRIEALHVDTNTVYDVTTALEAKKLIDASYGYLRVLGSRKVQKPTKGYVFRLVDFLEWKDITIVDDLQASKNVIITTIATGEEKEFPSLRKAAAYIKTDKKTISRRLGNGKEYMGYTFRLRSE